MNIHTGAIYMKQGYRLRRPDWHETNFLVVDKSGDIKFTHLTTSSKFVDGKLAYKTYEILDDLLGLSINDLLADDWEISEGKIK